MRTLKSALIVTALAALLLATIARTLAAPRTGIWYVAPPPAGNDGNDCATPSTPCATINAALNKPGFVPGDTVRVAVGTYTGTSNEVVLLNKDATLSGGWNSAFTAQTGMSTIDGEEQRFGIYIWQADTTVDRFIVRNGAGGWGSGVSSVGVLTLSNSTITNNCGGISTAGTAIISNSIISNNQYCLYSLGNGVSTSGALTVTNTTIKDNAGAGITAGPGNATINNSTISGNTDSGIQIAGSEVFLNNSTISNNNNAGIFIDYGTLTVNSSTISSNSGPEWGHRSGIFNWGTVYLQNTILSGNLPADCAGTITSLGYNIVHVTAGGNNITTTCTILTSSGDQIGVNPLLMPLQDNGGPTYTHAVPASSPAVNAGNPTGCMGNTGLLTTDQRGSPRIGRCDIGAYESQSTFSVEKRVDKPIGFSADSLTYQIILNNYGAAAVSGVLVTDTLPTQLTYINDSLTATSGSYSYNNRVITWNGSVNANSAVTITFGANIEPAAPIGTTIVNTATINGGGVVVTRTATTEIKGRLASVSKTVDRTTVSHNYPLSYTINFKMRDAAPATSIWMTDTLPSSLTYVPNSVSATSGNANYNNGVITWNGTASANESVTITFAAMVNSSVPIGTFIENSAILSSGEETFTRTASIYVSSRFDYRYKSVNERYLLPGETTRFEIAFKMSDAVGVVPVSISDTLPSGLTYVNNSLTATSGIANYSNGVITWNGVAGAGEIVRVFFEVTVNPTVRPDTYIFNFVTIGSDDDAWTTSDYIQVLNPFLYAYKRVDKLYAPPGTTVQYTINLRMNSRMGAALTRITDTLPSDLTYVTDSITATSGTVNYNNGTITWNGTVTADENLAITFQAKVNSSVPIGTSIVNAAIIDGAGQVFTSTATTNVVSHFTSASKTADKAKLAPGESVQYTIRLRLNYAASPTTIFVTDTVPSGLTYVANSLTATSGNSSHSSGTIFWNGPVNPDEEVTIRFDAATNPTTPSGTIANSASINANGEIVTPAANVTVVRETFLPMIVKPAGRIVGWVTHNGGAANGILLQLRFYDGATWSTTDTTTTDSTGYFAFVNPPSLAPGQAYYVRYSNSGDSQRVAFWNTRLLTSYTSGSYVEIGRFDLANITLTAPNPGSTVGLPYTFTWNVRPATPSDSYEFNLFDYTDGNPWWWTAPLGYRGNYTLNSLPPEFVSNTPYGWAIGVYSPDGGYGMSYYFYVVRMTNPESAPRLGQAPLRPRNAFSDLRVPLPMRKHP